MALPNLLVGLREGLEAGLVVTILIGAVRRLAPWRSVVGVWLGVVAAVVVSLSFGAVLTFTQAKLSPVAQEIFGGVTSLVTVVLVTSMVFWMRRAARGLSGDLRERVGGALAAGGAALVLTAFVAVAREGLEAALFVWTNAQAAGSSTSPLLGALIGLLLASGLCLGLYRQVLKVNLSRLFTVTGAVLVVIVAGVLAYGITDLQDAGVLPGLNVVAFDISAQVPTGTWWTETIRGVTNLNNRMSQLSVVAYLTYLVVVLTLFLRRKPSTAHAPLADPAAAVATRPRRRRLVVAGATVLIVLPVAGAVTWVAIDHRSAATPVAGDAVTVTDTSCADDWVDPATGATVYTVSNTSSHAVDVEIVLTASNAVVAEIEVLGPGTTRNLPAMLGSAAYHWTCVYAGAATTTSPSRTAVGPPAAVAAAIVPATEAELAPVLAEYRAYVDRQLDLLNQQVQALNRAVSGGDRAAAKNSWRSAYLTYHRIGAAYDAFGDAGAAVDGLATGLPAGVRDPGFVGFHRIEMDLWGGRSLSATVDETGAMVAAVKALYAQLPSFTFDPGDVTTRAHEIVEDTIRFVLTSESDYGSGSGYPTAQADLAGDRVLVDLLAPLLSVRDRTLVAAIHQDMDVLQHALATAVTSGSSVADAPPAIRQLVNAATSQLAETLAPIPDLLEIRAQ